MKNNANNSHSLTRRHFLQCATAAGAGLAFATPGASEQARTTGTANPNILLIMTDQQTASAMSCAGNPYVATPALDALAAQGVRFERAYCTQPLCTPFRSSLQTGRYPHEIGVVCNGLKIQGDFPMLGTLMNSADYECAYIGKWHVGTSFEKAGYTGLASDFRPDDKKTAAALAFLKRSHDTPFFLTVSFMNPHNVCELARGQELPDGPIGEPPQAPDALPPLPDNFALPDHEPSAIRKVKQSIPEIYPTKGWGELEWRRYLWSYYRLVEKVDAEIGRVLDALRNSDYADNTVIIFVSDHGEGVAMHQWNQKQILYDQCVRTPFIISGNGILPGRVANSLVSTALDIPQTILDFAGAAPPESMRGMSLKGLATGKAESLDREYVVAETVFARNTNLLGLRGRMMRTDRFKYCVYDVGENREQLFDMTADPGEVNNLAVQPDYADILEQHRKLLRAWSQETNDHDFPYVSLS